MSHTNTIDLSGISKQYAARDLQSHVKLKYREVGQGAPEELKKMDQKKWTEKNGPKKMDRKKWTKIN